MHADYAGQIAHIRRQPLPISPRPSSSACCGPAKPDGASIGKTGAAAGGVRGARGQAAAATATARRPFCQVADNSNVSWPRQLNRSHLATSAADIVSRNVADPQPPRTVQRHDGGQNGAAAAAARAGRAHAAAVAAATAAAARRSFF